jgi:hypothetical protein
MQEIAANFARPNLDLTGFSPVYNNLSRGNAEAVKWGELVVGDIADGRLLRETLMRNRPSAVVGPHRIPLYVPRAAGPRSRSSRSSQYASRFGTALGRPHNAQDEARRMALLENVSIPNSTIDHAALDHIPQATDSREMTGRVRF